MAGEKKTWTYWVLGVLAASMLAATSGSLGFGISQSTIVKDVYENKSELVHQHENLVNEAKRREEEDAAIRSDLKFMREELKEVISLMTKIVDQNRDLIGQNKDLISLLRVKADKQ